MPNASFNSEAIADTLDADFDEDDSSLTLYAIAGDDDDDDDGVVLVEWFGVEDIEDARARLRQTLGALADYVPLSQGGNGDYR